MYLAPLGPASLRSAVQNCSRQFCEPYRFASCCTASDGDNLQKLLHDLADVPEEQRRARFQCLMVYLRHEQGPTPIICQGTWEGRILFEPRGEHGFGYDPIFFVPTHNCSSAELPPEVKNELSHRGQALRKLVAVLSKQMVLKRR